MSEKRRLYFLYSRNQSEDALADAIPNLINLLWRIGFYLVEGRAIVDLIITILANSIRPEGTTCGPSFSIMTEQTPVAPAQPDGGDRSAGADHWP